MSAALTDLQAQVRTSRALVQAIAQSAEQALQQHAVLEAAIDAEINKTPSVADVQDVVNRFAAAQPK